MDARELLSAGRLDEALQALQQQVRANPADSKQRVFLFQLLCLQGQYDRAITQLNVAGEMDSDCLVMAQVYRPALNAEALRADVFAGQRSPLVFGEPAEWVGPLLQAARLVGQGQPAAAASLRAQAFEAARAVAGTINGAPFEWIADGDTRLGPMLEAILEGKYYWVPFERIAKIDLEEPADLRDVVWAPATFTWTNGGAAVGFIPARYPGSECSDDAALRMGRRTEFDDRGDDLLVGLGQRQWVTDAGEYPLLEVRTVELHHPDVPAANPAAEA